MFIINRLPVIALFLVLHCSLSFGDIITYQFTGAVTSRFNSGSTIGLPADRIFDATINVGNAVSGFFNIDTSLSPVETQPGAARYLQGSPLLFQANINGTIVETIGDFSFSILNNFSGTTDGLAIIDGQSSNLTSGSGTTISFGGSPETASLQLNLVDLQGTAFNSTSPPTTIPLAQMENRFVQIFGTRNGVTYSVDFRIDTLTAVPEPASLVFGVIAIVLTISRSGSPFRWIQSRCKG
jgi:hypothetical protein